MSELNVLIPLNSMLAKIEVPATCFYGSTSSKYYAGKANLILEKAPMVAKPMVAKELFKNSMEGKYSAMAAQFGALAGARVGAYIGVEAGAYVETLVVPGVGTLVGAVVGGITLCVRSCGALGSAI